MFQFCLLKKRMTPCEHVLIIMVGIGTFKLAYHQELTLFTFGFRIIGLVESYQGVH
jgi:hypothetical protein